MRAQARNVPFKSHSMSDYCDSTSILRSVYHAPFRNCRGFPTAEEEAAGRRAQKKGEAYWDAVLQAHIMQQHRWEIEEVALVPENYVWDVCLAALAFQERKRCPSGWCSDRPQGIRGDAGALQR